VFSGLECTLKSQFSEGESSWLAPPARKDPPVEVVRARRDTEPSRMLRALYRWDPFREMEPFFAILEDELEPQPNVDVKKTKS
jgi:hypothetical protein